MAVIGLKDLHYAKIESESKEATEYSEVKPFGPAMALNLSPSSNDEDLFADDAILFSESAKGPTTVEVNTAYLEEKVEADVLGKQIDGHGGIVDGVDDAPPYIAIGGKAKSARGGYAWFWICRDKIKPGEDNKSTQQDTYKDQTPKFKGTTLSHPHNAPE